jgi:cyclophilin family peptidyl-prolyl cis-trans isomerase
MKKLTVLFVVALLCLLTACGNQSSKESNQNTDKTSNQKANFKQWNEPPKMAIDSNKKYQAVISTNMGDITIELFTKDAPVTVNNFIFLANEHFYDNIVFHRIIKDFMIQTGDPKGDGSGGPGYSFKDELSSAHQYEKGIVAMANAGPNTNGSQFFICNGKNSEALNQNPNYTIFGNVTSGMDIVQKISNVKVEKNAQGEESAPVEKVFIKSISIENK